VINRGRQANSRSLSDVRAIGHLPLWTGFLAGPIIWSLHLVVSEFLLGAACSSGPAGFNGFTILGATGWRWVLLLVTGGFALLVLAADFVAFRAWRESRIGTEVTGVVGGAAGRSGWLALAGILMSTLFLIGILLAGVPIFWLSGCT
jgi:hypothetical protein